jgi:hypothetical protein
MIQSLINPIGMRPAIMKMNFNFNFNIEDSPAPPNQSIRRITTACDQDHTAEFRH